MNEKIIRQYYAAYEKKDWHMLELILADDFTFTSPAGDDHINLKEYKERCWPNANNTRRFDLEKVLVAGDDAFVTYNGWTNDDNPPLLSSASFWSPFFRIALRAGILNELVDATGLEPVTPCV